MMLQQDELYSIQRFIYNSLPGNLADKPRVVLKRPEAEGVVRPYFKIDNPAGPKELITPQWYQDRRIWIVTYLAAKEANGSGGRADAQNRGDAWLRKLFNDSRYKTLIPLWLFDFPYFPARLYLKDGISTLAAGSYSVQVVAENDLGQVTKPSAVTTINVPTANNKQISVQIPREPKGFPIGYRFHIYLSGSVVTPTAAHRVGSVNATGKVDPLFTIANDVPNGVAQVSPPVAALMSGLPAQSEVRYRYMRVMPETVDTQMIEDPEVDGLFNYTVRFQTQAPGLREYPHPQAISDIDVAVAPTF